MTDLPQAAIEAAAKAIEIGRCEDGLYYSEDIARTALTAALPHLTGWQPIEVYPKSVETDGQFLGRIGTNASLWAEEFVKRFGGDEGLMIGWFANAIEAGREAGKRSCVKTG